VIEGFDIVQCTDADTGSAHLAVDIGTPVRVISIQGHGVKGGGQPLGFVVFRKEFESVVGAVGVSFTGKHSCWVFIHPL